MKLNSNIKILGVCAGQGVLLHPVKKNVIGNIEPRSIFHSPGDKQWKANFKCPLYKHITLGTIKIAEADVIISTPDCGSGSILRLSRAKQLGDHHKNESLMNFFEAVTLYQPKIFLFENLITMFKSYSQEDFETILTGYRLIMINGSVSDFGNSQKSRKRLVIVGIRWDLPKKVDKYFKLPKLKAPLKTCEELYGDISQNDEENIAFGHAREQSSSIITIHARRKLEIDKIRLEWTTNLKGKKRWEVDPKLGFKFSTAPGVYRNLANDYPATARKANRQFDHNGNMLSPRQLARIMGVPDDFKIYMPVPYLYWINKGRVIVTKGAVYELGTWFKHKLIKSQHLWHNS